MLSETRTYSKNRCFQNASCYSGVYSSKNACKYCKNSLEIHIYIKGTKGSLKILPKDGEDLEIRRISDDRGFPYRKTGRGLEIRRISDEGSGIREADSDDCGFPPTPTKTTVSTPIAYTRDHDASAATMAPPTNSDLVNISYIP